MEISKDLIYWLDIGADKEAKKKIMTGDEIKSTERDLKILEKLDIKPSDTVLDFGCGTGRLMKKLYKKCKLIIGADISDKMLFEAMRNIPFGNTMFRNLKDECGTGLPIHFVDKIYSIIVLQHIEKPTVFKILENMNKCLKIGGKMLLQFPDIDTNKLMYQSYMMSKNSFGPFSPRIEFYSETELRFMLDLLKGEYEVWKEGTDWYVLFTKKEDVIFQEYLFGAAWKS